MFSTTQTMVIGLSFLNDGEGQLTNNRGRLFDMTWTYQEDKLTIASEALGREQSVGIVWEGKNTFFIDNCLCTYEFNRQQHDLPIYTTHFWSNGRALHNGMHYGQLFFLIDFFGE